MSDTTSCRRLVVTLALVGLVLAPLGACRGTGEKRPDPEPLAPGEQPPGTWYEVRRGDTLWSLSRRHGLTPDEVAEVNGIQTSDTLLPGQLLFLPGASEPSVDDEPDARAAARATPPALAGSATLAWPLEEGVLLRDYSREGLVPYEGLMLAAPAGTPVLAAADGDVLHVGQEGGYGTMVLVRHPGDLVTIYAHVDDVKVAPGERVRRGQAIATVGTSGRAESPQLHFQVRSGRTPVDPLTVLPAP